MHIKDDRIERNATTVQTPKKFIASRKRKLIFLHKEDSTIKTQFQAK
jgi:hypothetical protein